MPSVADAKRFADDLERSIRAFADQTIEGEARAELVGAITRWEALNGRLDHLKAGLECLRALDTADLAVTDAVGGALDLEATLVAAWDAIRETLAKLSEEQFEHVLADPSLDGAAYRLRREREEGARKSNARRTSIVDELVIDGLHGWARLAEATFDGLTFSLNDSRGMPIEASFTRRFDFLWSPDALLRRSAFEGLQDALARVSPVLTASLNGLSGVRSTVARLEGCSVFELTAWGSGIKPSTMQMAVDAARARRGVLHDYLSLKAQLLGLSRLGVQDRSAPPPGAASAPLTQQLALEHIIAAFDRIVPPMSAAARAMRSRGWIDAGAGERRANAGFALFSPITREPRVFINLDGSFYSQGVFAHELGHGIHCLAFQGTRPMLRDAPSVLSETAAIAAEHVFRAGALAGDAVSDAQRIEVLSAELDTGVNYLLRLPRDFEFERAVYELREGHYLTPERLVELQRQAHFEWFGDTLGSDGDPYSWAGTPLLYSSYSPFFNVPYVLGFLLSSAIVDRLESERLGWNAYTDFLRESGSDFVESLVRRTLALDIEDPAFWDEGFARVERRLTELRAVAARWGA